MQDTKVIPINERYRYNLFINTKAIWDFLAINKTQNIIKNTNQIHLLSFLVDMSSTDGIINMTAEDGAKYIYVTDNFILNNLKFLGVQSRQLKNILKQLEIAKTIQRKTINNNQRYIRVHPELIELWHVENWTMKASSYMANHRPKLWDSFKNNWLPILGAEKFKDAIDWCNDKINMKEIKYNDYDAVYRLMENTLAKWNKDKHNWR